MRLDELSIITKKFPEGRLTDHANAVMQAVSAGVIAPSAGGELLSALGQVGKDRDADDLLQRTEAS